MIYEGTIQYTGVDNKGNQKNFKEQYVVNNRVSFADAEVELYVEMQERGLSDCDVIALKRSKIKEIANQRTNVDDLLWMAEMQDVFHDDEENEKYIKYKVLFYSKTYESANLFITEYAKQGYDLSLVSLKLTKFVDVI